MAYCMTMKREEAMNVVIEDNQFDSFQSDLVDFAFSSGVVEYLNLTGLGKPEKNVKVARFVRILQQISEMDVPTPE